MTEKQTILSAICVTTLRMKSGARFVQLDFKGEDGAVTTFTIDEEAASELASLLIGQLEFKLPKNIIH